MRPAFLAGIASRRFLTWEPGCQGMMTVLENAVKDDRDWARLGLIPDLLKAWPEALTKAHAVVADFEVQLAFLLAHCSAHAYP